MTYPDAQSLNKEYGTTLRLNGKLVADLSNKDSLIQPFFEANCLNWVLGHRPAILSASSTQAASMMMGVFRSWRCRRKNSQPSISGIIRLRTIRSGL